MLVIHVSRPELDRLFAKEDAMTKIQAAEWSSIVRGEVPAKTYLGCTSQIIKHFDSDGRHRATTHRILDKGTGTVYHEHGKDITIGDQKFAFREGRSDP